MIARSMHAGCMNVQYDGPRNHQCHRQAANGGTFRAGCVGVRRGDCACPAGGVRLSRPKKMVQPRLPRYFFFLQSLPQPAGDFKVWSVHEMPLHPTTSKPIRPSHHQARRDVPWASSSRLMTQHLSLSVSVDSQCGKSKLFSDPAATSIP